MFPPNKPRQGNKKQPTSIHYHEYVKGATTYLASTLIFWYTNVPTYTKSQRVSV